MGLGLVIFLFAMVVAASPYRDYAGSRMPDYGIDDENHEMTPIPDDFIDKSPQAGASFDYRNEDERDSRKHALDMEIDDYVINKNKRFSPKSKIETQEEIMPEDKPRKRNGKTNRRKHSRFNSEGGNSNNKYSRFRKVDDDNTNNEDYRVKEEDYRENEEKETERFHRREIINRQARRKPRERPLNVILQDTDDKYVKGDEGFSALEDKIHENKKSESSEYEFEDMRRVNDIKEKLTVTPKRTTVTVLEPSRKPTTLNRRMNTPEKKKISTPISEAGELSMAERSRLSILKKVNKKENLNTTKTAKPPVLMQVTNKIQTVVMLEPNMYKEMPRVKQVVENSPERVGVAKKLMRRKLVANVKSLQELTDNWDEMICDYIDVSLLNVACRLPQDSEETTVTAAFIAARELGALLGHRQRKDIQVPYDLSTRLPSTFSPRAVDVHMDDEWNRFIQFNRASRIHCSFIVLTLLSYGQLLK